MLDFDEVTTIGLDKIIAVDGRLELKALAIVELEKETETDSKFDVDETAVVGLDEEVWMDERLDSKRPPSAHSVRTVPKTTKQMMGSANGSTEPM